MAKKGTFIINQNGYLFIMDELDLARHNAIKQFYEDKVKETGLPLDYVKALYDYAEEKARQQQHKQLEDRLVKKAMRDNPKTNSWHKFTQNKWSSK